MNFAKNITLQGKNIDLRSFQEDHLKVFKSFAKDEEVSKFTDCRPGEYIEEQGLQNYLDREDAISFTIIEKSTGKIIGEIALSDINHKENKAEIGITIFDKNFWGKGLEKEAVSLTLEYGFRVLKLETIFLDVWEENTRAINLYHRLGFTDYSILKDQVSKRGIRHNKILMVLDRNSNFIRSKL